MKVSFQNSPEQSIDDLGSAGATPTVGKMIGICNCGSWENLNFQRNMWIDVSRHEYIYGLPSYNTFLINGRRDQTGEIGS